MAQLPKYYIVEAKALPEVFLKVAEAKWLLETGEVATVNDAARATGISRSAFYKYRDSISPFQNLMAGRILTFQLLLRDMTGLLSSILTIFVLDIIYFCQLRRKYTDDQSVNSDKRLCLRDDLGRDGRHLAGR